MWHLRPCMLFIVPFLLLISLQSIAGLSNKHVKACGLAIRGRNYTLEPVTLDRAIVNSAGSTHRFNVFLHKVLHQKAGDTPLNIVVHGGSFSTGPNMPPSALYPRHLVDALKLVNPYANINVTNSAMGSTRPSFGLLCAEPLMPVGVDVDLVMVEYNPNLEFSNKIVAPKSDWQMYERFLRRMLQWRGSPSVVIVQMLFPVVITWADNFPMPYHASTEDAALVLAQYYGLPVISMRNALYLKQKESLPGFGLDMRQADKWHLNELGHSYIGDMLAWLVQSNLEQLCIHSLLGTSGQALGKASSGFSAVFKKHRRTFKVAVVQPPPLPPPMLEPAASAEGQQGRYKMCVLPTQLSTYVKRHESWTFSSDDRLKKKFGYISTTANSLLELAVPRPTPATNESLVLYLAYLRSYTDMGAASVSCISGCACKDTHIDAAWATKVSLNWIHPIDVEWSSGESCEVHVVNVGGKSPSAKFKLTGFMLVVRDALMSAANPDLFGYFAAE